jgi:hypothetical protein
MILMIKMIKKWIELVQPVSYQENHLILKIRIQTKTQRIMVNDTGCNSNRLLNLVRVSLPTNKMQVVKNILQPAFLSNKNKIMLHYIFCK